MMTSEMLVTGMGISRLCRLLGIPRRSYYRWISEPNEHHPARTLMWSFYHLDSYKREYIELSRYKGESRGGFANLLYHPHGTGDAHA